MWDTALYVSALVVGCIFAAIGVTMLALVAGALCGGLYTRAVLKSRRQPLH